MAVSLLADRPDLLPVVAGWMHGQWLRPWGVSADGALRTMQMRAQRDGLPLTLVAHQGDAALGCVSLVMDDLPATPGQTPCIAGLFVPSRERGQGIGRRLVHAAQGRAERLGLAPLSLYTVDRRGFYEALGWREVQAATVAGPSGPIAASFMQRAPRVRNAGQETPASDPHSP